MTLGGEMAREPGSEGRDRRRSPRALRSADRPCESDREALRPCGHGAGEPRQRVRRRRRVLDEVRARRHAAVIRRA